MQTEKKEKLAYFCTDPLLADILPGYIERRTKDVKEIRDAFKSHDFSRVRAICHQIRGNSVTFGYIGLYEICVQIEEDLSKELYDHAETLINLLQDSDNWVSNSIHE